MEQMLMRFPSREEAGKILAKELRRYARNSLAVFALPLGGVPVAYHVAKVLKAPLDIIPTRRICVTIDDTEHVFGAIAPGVAIINEETASSLYLGKKEIQELVNRGRKKLEEDQAEYKSGSWVPHTLLDTIILVNDGLATGIAARAAIQSIKNRHPESKIIFAAPVGEQSSLQLLSKYAEVVYIATSPETVGVDTWYDDTVDFMSNADMLRYIEEANAETYARLHT